MSYGADKLGVTHTRTHTWIHTHTDTHIHTQTDAGDDNSRRLKLTSRSKTIFTKHCLIHWISNPNLPRPQPHPTNPHPPPHPTNPHPLTPKTVQMVWPRKCMVNFTGLACILKQNHHRQAISKLNIRAGRKGYFHCSLIFAINSNIDKVPIRFINNGKTASTQI